MDLKAFTFQDNFNRECAIRYPKKIMAVVVLVGVNCKVQVFHESLNYPAAFVKYKSE